TEFIRAQPGHELVAVSLQIGSVRLTERCVKSDPPSTADCESLQGTIDRAIDGLGWSGFRPQRLVGIAGTVTTICAVALGLRNYDAQVVHGHRLARSEVRRALDLFGSRTLLQRKELPGLLEGRADVIFAGASILDRIMEQFAATSLTVSDQGVRWGLAWREIDRARGAQA
ncbi:MAG TPA: hypothetical protein VEJ86_12645, partial [Candidatus Binataceae bacterium]|nr:hypothetical protein [Candidatus Binataceae bacterium]